MIGGRDREDRDKCEEMVDGKEIDKREEMVDSDDSKVGRISYLVIVLSTSCRNVGHHRAIGPRAI